MSTIINLGEFYLPNMNQERSKQVSGSHIVIPCVRQKTPIPLCLIGNPLIHAAGCFEIKAMVTVDDAGICLLDEAGDICHVYDGSRVTITYCPCFDRTTGQWYIISACMEIEDFTLIEPERR